MPISRIEWRIASSFVPNGWMIVLPTGGSEQQILRYAQDDITPLYAHRVRQVLC